MNETDLILNMHMTERGPSAGEHWIAEHDGIAIPVHILHIADDHRYVTVEVKYCDEKDDFFRGDLSMRFIAYPCASNQSIDDPSSLRRTHIARQWAAMTVTRLTSARNRLSLYEQMESSARLLKLSMDQMRSIVRGSSRLNANQMEILSAHTIEPDPSHWHVTFTDYLIFAEQPQWHQIIECLQRRKEMELADWWMALAKKAHGEAVQREDAIAMNMHRHMKRAADSLLGNNYL